MTDFAFPMLMEASSPCDMLAGFRATRARLACLGVFAFEPAHFISAAVLDTHTADFASVDKIFLRLLPAAHISARTARRARHALSMAPPAFRAARVLVTTALRNYALPLASIYHQCDGRF